MVKAARTVAEIHDVIRMYADVEVPLAGDIPAVLISHGVQCAELLALEYPDDLALQVAGLLHDIGLLLVPGDELGHPRNGADYVRELVGDRCADLIELHVDAQRYLEMTVHGYQVAPPPTAAFAEQPTAMTEAEGRMLEAHPLFDAVIALRHADDRASDVLRRESDFGPWVARLEALTMRYRGQSDGVMAPDVL